MVQTGIGMFPCTLSENQKKFEPTHVLHDAELSERRRAVLPSHVCKCKITLSSSSKYAKNAILSTRLLSAGSDSSWGSRWWARKMPARVPRCRSAHYGDLDWKYHYYKRKLFPTPIDTNVGCTSNANVPNNKRWFIAYLVVNIK